MSLVIDHVQSPLATATSTTVGHPAFRTVSKSSTVAEHFTPIKSKDPVRLRQHIGHRRSSLPGTLRSSITCTPSKRLSCDIPSVWYNGSIASSPIKKVVKRLADLDPFTVFDSSSRDSGFESEGSRFSSKLSTASVNSNPATPSSAGDLTVVGAVAQCDLKREGKPVSISIEASTQVGTTRLCLWDNCEDPNLASESEDTKLNLLGHLLSRHVQPLEMEDHQKVNGKDQVTFKCLWKGCKVYGKGSKVYSWLEGHVTEKHAGPRPFVCPLPGCSLRFSSKVLAERHVNNHFNKQEPMDSEDDKAAAPAPAVTSKTRKPSPTPPMDSSRSSSIKRQRSTNTGRSEGKEQNGKRVSQRKAPASTVKNGQRKVSERSTKGKRSDGILVNTPRTTRQSSKRSRSPSCQRSCRETKSKKSPISSPVPAISKKRCGSNCAGQPFSITPVCGASTVSNGKRKAPRARSAEDAFDAMYSRAMQVLSARCTMSTMKNVNTGAGSKRNNTSCQKCSGNSFKDSPSSHGKCPRIETIPKDCGCSDYITFHAKVLAKRLCTNLGNDSNEKQQWQLFCSWIPAGLLTPKWMDETSFKRIIRLPRSLFPYLENPGDSSGDGE